jgi:rod shape determining protein RodA
MVLFGWANIYSAVYDESHQSIFDFSQRYGKQLIWIFAAIVLGFIVLIIDSKFFSAFSYLFYGVSILSLIAVLVLGAKVGGSRSWFQFGSFAIQPSEFAKFATALAVAKYLSGVNITLSRFKHIFRLAMIIGAPAILILLQHDTGSALVYSAFVLVLFREGLSGKVLIFGSLAVVLFILTLLVNKYIMIASIFIFLLLILFYIGRTKSTIRSLAVVFIIAVGFIYSVDYVFENILEPHQKNRIEVLLGKKSDPRGDGYNVNQSKIAIGSGGLSGKGYLKGTQTKFNFVPEQSTDFIFCTVGEEWGFGGSAFVIGLFMLFLFRILRLAERQRSFFARIYGYGLASIVFFHFAVNIAMTIGLAPVIGIPLPFFSYGGSSLWAFTILLFIFIRQDASRLEVL